ncbi:helicase-associated domain-containing protein, partial [Streptomyces varsoviensis]|uniref:helicase-associated domain-containing protein n=1 Tax=Streptomyces varsoviensis TaxID=67373 RepID=UPI0004CAC31F
MDGLDTLARALGQRTPEQLADLLTRHREPLSHRPAPTHLRGLATALWSYETVHHLVLHLDRPRLQLLAAIARAGQRLAEENAPPRPPAPPSGAGFEALMSHSLSFPQLAAEPVPAEAAYAELGAGGPGPDREAATAALSALYEDGLAAPAEDGRTVVPPRVPQLLGGLDLKDFTRDAPRPAPDALTRTDPALVGMETRAAATALSSALDRLLAALAERPAALRKSGGLAVREIKRLAKAAGTGEDRARLLLDTAEAAGLIALSRNRDGTTALPTAAYDDWLTRPAGERLAPVLTAWAELRAIPTLGAPGEPPATLVRGHDDRYAAPLRRALLEALAALPEGTGAAVPAPPLPEEPSRALDGLLHVADWYRPLAVTGRPMAAERSAHTLDEAAFLGVVAHGTLTPLGRALLAGPDALRAELDRLLPPPLEKAHFQADLTAVAPGAPSAALADLLGACADRESEGHAVTWRFSAASVRRALDAGHTPDALLVDLTAASASGSLPQPLTYLIGDTARTHGLVRVVRTACCLRSDDEALVRELAAHRELRALGLRAIAATVLVAAEPPETVLRTLRAAGYAPVLEAETGTTVVERAAAHRSKAPAPLPAARRAAEPLALAERLLRG